MVLTRDQARKEDRAGGGGERERERESVCVCDDDGGEKQHS